MKEQLLKKGAVKIVEVKLKFDPDLDPVHFRTITAAEREQSALLNKPVADISDAEAGAEMVRLTLVDADGTRLFDSSDKTEELERPDGTKYTKVVQTGAEVDLATLLNDLDISLFGELVMNAMNINGLNGDTEEQAKN